MRDGAASRVVYLAFCVFVFVFLVAPILVIIPLSFNAEPYFTFTEGMLRLDPDAWSLRWYEALVEDARWSRALATAWGSGSPPPCWRRCWEPSRRSGSRARRCPPAAS